MNDDYFYLLLAGAVRLAVLALVTFALLATIISLVRCTTVDSKVNVVEIPGHGGLK